MLSLLGCAAEAAPGVPADGTLGSARRDLGPGLRLISINARIPKDTGENSWSARLPRLAGLVRWRRAHAIGFQELARSRHHDTLAELAAALPEYWAYWVNRGDGEMIAIFLDSDRLQPLDHGYRNTSNAERNAACSSSDPQDPKNRPIQYVLVRDRQTNTEFYLYNTHYPSRSACERDALAAIVARYIHDRKEPTLPVVLVGDMNDGVEPTGDLNRSFQRLLDATGLAMSYFQHHPRGPNGRFKTSNGDYDKLARSGRMIDHVLFTPWDTSTSAAGVDFTLFTRESFPVPCEIVTDERCPSGAPVNSLNLYSDHWAVWAHLEW